MRKLDPQVGYGVVISLAAILGSLGCEKTTYAPGYSHQAFKEIKAGMTEQQVVQLVGQPLERLSSPWCEAWEYGNESCSTQTVRRWGIFKTRIVTVYYDSAASFYFNDRGNLSFHTGGLFPDATVSKCRNTTDVLTAFGQPKERMVFPAETRLYYSRPAGGATYRATLVILDKDDRVTSTFSFRAWSPDQLP